MFALQRYKKIFFLRHQIYSVTFGQGCILLVKRRVSGKMKEIISDLFMRNAVKTFTREHLRYSTTLLLTLNISHTFF